MEKITVSEKDLQIVFTINDNQTVSLIHFSTVPFDEAWLRDRDVSIFQPIELKVTGLDIPGEKHGPKYSLTSPGYRLVYVSHAIVEQEVGKRLQLLLKDEETALEVSLNFQFYEELSIVKSWTEVTNLGQESLGIEYLSSFSLVGLDCLGLAAAEDKLRFHLPHNAWQRELNWRTYSLNDLGLINTQKDFRRSSSVYSVTNTGNWSTKKFLPLGLMENQEVGTVLFWQIEHNGSWHWEVGDQDGYLYLKISGPTEQESHWWQELHPGETFVSVPTAVGSVNGGFDQAVAELTRYRRRIRRQNRDNEELPVIFNDYMNCLFGDPTTANELPLIDKAAEAGCDYYCIDCGWYSAGYWWDGVGEWQEARERFPNGLREVTDHIKQKGMIPGLWLELEVMGIKSPLADKVDADWFFERHGKRTYDRSRYQLDFRNPAVREYATSVIERLIADYGIGYIKMDYNVDMGIGTDRGADSPGAGLLEHNRAYLRWLDEIFLKYPDLVIENCSSGGLRMDYALLSRHSIQSTSDQEDYQLYSTISANAPSGVTPEQAAVWSYPLKEGDDEETVFNMVNSMLLRIHQSGHLAELSESRFALVKEGIALYKEEIRRQLPESTAFWPLGPAKYEDDWAVFGLKNQAENCYYLAVWRRNSRESVLSVPISALKGQKPQIAQIYPLREDLQSVSQWHSAAAVLTVELSKNVSARLFRLTI